MQKPSDEIGCVVRSSAGPISINLPKRIYAYLAVWLLPHHMDRTSWLSVMHEMCNQRYAHMIKTMCEFVFMCASLPSQPSKGSIAHHTPLSKAVDMLPSLLARHGQIRYPTSSSLVPATPSLLLACSLALVCGGNTREAVLCWPSAAVDLARDRGL